MTLTQDLVQCPVQKFYLRLEPLQSWAGNLTRINSLLGFLMCLLLNGNAIREQPGVWEFGASDVC